MAQTNPGPGDAESTDAELEGLDLNDEWVNEAKRHERTADDRADHYARINQGHRTAQPPRSWSPSGGAESRSAGQAWVKVTAIVLIAIAALAVLTLLRALG